MISRNPPSPENGKKHDFPDHQCYPICHVRRSLHQFWDDCRTTNCVQRNLFGETNDQFVHHFQTMFCIGLVCHIFAFLCYYLVEKINRAASVILDLIFMLVGCAILWVLSIRDNARRTHLCLRRTVRIALMLISFTIHWFI